MNNDRSTQSGSVTSSIVLTLGSADELFEAPPPGRVHELDLSRNNWDAVGAALGEPGVERLLRLLHAEPRAAEIAIRIRNDAGERSDRGTRGQAADLLIARLRVWMRAQVASNVQLARASRRAGLQALAICMVVLGITLGLAWLMDQEAILGPPGPLRVLISEALVIAGWVVMWRPIELLVFDPMRPTLERRMIERALSMPTRVEWLAPSDAPSGQGVKPLGRE